MKKAVVLIASALLLASCGASSIQKDGANIKSLYFDNVPETPIKVGEFDDAGIVLHVEYSDRTSAEFPVKENWLPEQYLHYLSEEGSYEVNIYFRGKETTLAFTMANNPNAPQYRVSFLDYQGAEMESYVLSHRKDAVFHGEVPTRAGYTFTGWDQSLYGVASDMVYRPMYQQN